MNYTTVVFLINKNVRAIACTYEENGTQETFKSLDQSIMTGDFVVVPTSTRHKMTVVKVSGTDVDVDFDAPKPMEWVIGKVDRTAYNLTVSQEATAISAIKSAEIRKKRTDLSEALFADNVETLKALPIAVLNGDAPPVT